jgi:hypothetical protein
MLGPKQKADELFNKYDNYPLTYEWKKQCALIAVDEILNYLKTDGFSIQINYWQDVKQEIEKL